ncbi:hypothetical protein [Dyadobacter frigoris]|uniref:Uncharacterized protein n=1 Tax=Dyadobacter frigoris TaxID=2576211 RepID=A0A4U6DFG2_9BACT|nr:hypothetical protein [Dyadobacter frigoris]TKT93304.1 hypothetical protein FDK13_05480 [Dyadobacter frigoris]
MAKDDDEEEKPIFPPQYSHLEKPFKEAQEQVNQIDKAIANLRTKQGPTLSYRPPGADDANIGYKPKKTEKRFNQHRDIVSRNFERKVHRETRDADPKLASHLRSLVKHKLSRVVDKDKTPSELKDIRGEVKKTDRSFGYMESLHFSRFTHEKDGAKSNDGKSGIQSYKKEFSLDEMSDRFIDKLSRQSGNGKEEMNPKRDVEEPNME